MWINYIILVYAEDVVKTVTSVAMKSRSMFTAVDSVSRARARLAARKRNIRNNLEQEDFVNKMNFLNLWSDLDDALLSLKELLMMVTIWQQCERPGRVIDCRHISQDLFIRDFQSASRSDFNILSLIIY